MNIILNQKTNEEKIAHVCMTRREELQNELSRMETVETMLLDTFAKPGVDPMDMDAVFNTSVREWGTQQGTEAQMILSTLLGAI